jgi:4-amino-4-deoxychorismate lyase
VVDLLRGGVTQPVHRLQDELALRREPQAPLPEFFGQGSLGHGTSIVARADTLRHVWDRIVVVPGSGPLPADTAVLRADDRGALSGDGVFETLHVRDGVPWLLDEHLDRMARSAALLELPLPPVAALATQACQAGPGTGEAALRIICTRGPEGGPPTVWATLSPVPPSVVRERRDGVTVTTASLGVTATARAALPWLPAGAKTLSYASHHAARRWAAAQGADDLLWTSTDGYALEAPTANVVWLAADTLCTVPAAQTGILRGVTAAWLLDRASALGMDAAERMVTPDELRRADGVWLTSSLRGLTEVRALDGVPLGPSAHTAALHEVLGHPV